MSKKWANSPLSLTIRPPTASSSSEDNQELQRQQQDPLSTVTVLPPESVNSNSLSHRHSILSDAQYAFADTTNHYLDLPSAVPFQDFVSPGLPSAEFPSSVRGFVSPPGTSSTINFPDPSTHQILVAYNNATTPGEMRQSNPAIPSDHSTPSANTYPITAAPTSGATALSRADSSVSYDSVWSHEGSQQHIALDITQFPRPPHTASDEPFSTRSSPNVASLNPNRKQLKPPASPLYEESEPAASRPLTPNAGEASYQYPTSTSSQQQSSTSLEQTRDTQDADSLIIQYLRPQSDAGNDLILPSLAPTSARASYQSHMTAASRGSSSLRMSIGDPSTRASAVPESSPAAWDEVMNSVKPHWNSSESVPGGDFSTTHSFVMSAISTGAAVEGTSTTGQEDGTSINAPPAPSNNLLSPFSVESTSDVYSAIGRMSFPKPPIFHTPPSEEPSSPVSPGPPRSPWVTGLTLKTKSNRGSPATPKRRPEDTPLPSLLTPVVLPLLHSVREPSTLTAISPPLILHSPAEEYVDAAYSSSGKESNNMDSQRLEVPVESRNSSSLSVEAPSYDRRVSDLLRAANEPVAPARDSVTSTMMTSSDSQRNSVDGAILGVARAASLSVRAKALLTRGPSLVTESLEVVLPYVVPSPSTSVGPSENSFVSAPSILTRAEPRTLPDTIERGDALGKPSKLPSHFGSLPRPPAIHTPGGAVLESINSGLSYDERGDEISLQRFQSRDIPNSAFPLNQSTPFENYFPSGGAPSAYRQPRHGEHFNPADFTRSQSKLSRSSVLTTISRASSRVAKAMSWFQKKPLPSLPSSPTREKHEKSLPNPGDDMPAPDLALRAAAVDQYLEVGELPYDSPSASPLPPGQTHVRRSSAPRRSVQSVLSSLSDRARGERRTKSVGFSQIPDGMVDDRESRVGSFRSFLASRRKKVWFFALLWCFLAVAVPIGVIFGRRALNNSTASDCGDGLAGNSCQLNSTCVCTSTISGRCDPVGQSLIDLIPNANSIFGLNLTSNSLALQLWDLQGQPMGGCAAQVVLVDVSPALNQSASPRRTEWTRTAILYNLLRTYDLQATEVFRSSIASANFGSLPDIPLETLPTNLKFEASGFEVDVAAMTFSAKALSWSNNSAADSVQVQRVGLLAGNALDRMYSFASASSTQRSTALKYYWTTDLQLPEDGIPNFLSSISSAPIILSFDGASSAIADFLASITGNNGSSFPAPLACYPGMPDQARANIGTIEQHAFDLNPLPVAPSALDTACFPDRPTYGVLDVLRLRRPFGDARESMRVTSAQLIAEAGTRAILHGGEQLVGLTGSRDNGSAIQTNFTIAIADPREYGTIQHLQHVALSYLLAFPSVDLAKQAAQFIMNANEATLPPTSGDGLFDESNALDSLPTIEVAVFGSILPIDMATFRADLATPNGTLFFGSQSADIFRKWALRDEDDLVLWSNSSTLQKVVHDSITNNAAFGTVWSQAAQLISTAAAVGRGTGLPEMKQIMDSLQSASLFD